MDKYYYELILGKPICYNNLIFYPITIDQITDIMDLETFKSYMLPFIITLDFLISKNIISEDIKEDFNIFEDYIVKENNMLECIAFIIGIFCKVFYIKPQKNVINLYKDSDNLIFQITKDNFNDISDILCKLTCTNKIKVEVQPKNLSKRQKDVWEKLHSGRIREAKKNEIHFYDIMNICSYSGNYYIPISEIKKMTLWQLMNCYKSKTEAKNYDDNLAISLMTHDLKPILNTNHWSKKLLIRN